MTPTKFQSLFMDDVYFEKQKDGTTWLSYYNKRVNENFTQIFAEKDSFGSFVVVLKVVNRKLFVRLTEGFAFTGENSTYQEEKFYPGYWLDPKKGNLLSTKY